jgi:hypothetical protein
MEYTCTIFYFTLRFCAGSPRTVVRLPKHVAVFKYKKKTISGRVRLKKPFFFTCYIGTTGCRQLNYKIL